jgi:hypothetical protein
VVIGEAHETVREPFDDMPISSARTSDDPNTLVPGSESQTQKDADKIAKGVRSFFRSGEVILGECANPSE